ncbi:MAG: hypothetical protein JRN56_01110 [Nitrososphaerota archaeon]|jgi:hypothetical protein|nr:hypothetical protein [Nitrososphaerota archaeon]MDG6903281.1 hypothetical protein [Nitrososphaerota archaeon]MDG6911858.1 hypothetical protein [Nitrososphaerota archaeon]MDG6940661.1 hypothetical protein [Nitrososphaerota archaeon]MDG6960971.1 hypothetical protein [Nitrososphaerota archaeon]
MNRAQKLNWYSQQLISEAETAEKAGNGEHAVAQYLQAAEILLLLAKVEASYAAWKNYTDKASLCQRKARMLIAQSPSDTGWHAPSVSPTGASPRS